MKEKCRSYRDAFPDVHFVIEQQLAVGDHVVSYWKGRGRHEGEVFGLAPTGRSIEVEGIKILPLENGRIVGHTVVWDALGLMKQLGALPETN